METLNRIYAMFLRHWYILRSSPARLIEFIYWPTIQMVLWGFISQYLMAQQASTLAYALATFLGAVLLWDALFRSQIGVSISYLEEVWSRNLGHLFVSPLRTWEWCLSMVLFSVCRTLVGLIPALFLAIPFYGFSMFDLGVPVIVFFFNLMFMGWWLGIFIVALLIKTGPSGEVLAWAIAFFIMPFCAVYYPVSVLPEWGQVMAQVLPASHVFEGLRGLVIDKAFNAGHMWWAFGLNCFYTVVAMGVLQISFSGARRDGTLLQAGE